MAQKENENIIEQGKVLSQDKQMQQKQTPALNGKEQIASNISKEELKNGSQLLSVDEQRTYNYNVPKLFHFIFIQLFRMMASLKVQINIMKAKGSVINIRSLPNIYSSDDPSLMADNFYKGMEVMCKSKNAGKQSKEQGTEMENEKREPLLTKWEVIKLAWGNFKFDAFLILFFGILDTIFKIANSFILQRVIKSIIDSNKDEGYMWAGILTATSFLSSTCRHNSWKLGQQLSGKFRLMFVNILYKKIAKLSAYSIKSANLGTIINFVAQDLQQMEVKFMFLFVLILSPIFITLATILLVWRLGVWGFLGIFILLLTFPIQQIFQKQSIKSYKKKQGFGDQNSKFLSEVIDGIRLIKMYAWELAFQKLVNSLRYKETNMLMKQRAWQISERAISISSSIIAAYITFLAVHYSGNGELDTSKIFSTIEILNNMRINLMMFAGIGIGFIFEFKTLLTRFIDIISIEEIQMKQITYSPSQNEIEFTEQVVATEQNLVEKFTMKSLQSIENEVQSKVPHISKIDGGDDDKNKKNDQVLIELQNMYAFWNPQNLNNPVLKNITFSFERKKLYGIIGKIDSGKSSLLQLFLKEIPRYSGLYKNENSMAYVEQEPYIFSGTVRDNIMFGKEMDEEFYQKTLKLCQLLPDMEEMGESRDLTMIGEKGINLSGGQKARISLARAVYSRADVYLLDDPLSAVDAKVAKNIFHKVIKELLIDQLEKTVLLVTHQVHFTKECNTVLLMQNGFIKAQGSFENIKEQIFGQFDSEELAKMSRKTSIQENYEDQKVKNKTKTQKKKNALFSNEEKEQINITTKTYTRLFSYSKIPGFILILAIFFILNELYFAAFHYIIGKYDEEPDKRDQIFLYVGISCLLYLIGGLLKYNILVNGLVRSSRNIYLQMFNTLIRSPVVYFDKNPTGQILNRFTNDMGILDGWLQQVVIDCIEGPLYFLNLMITIFIINPWLIIPGVAQIFLLFLWYGWSKPIILELKRLDLIHKSPVFSQFSSTTSGILQIKVYGQQQRFIEQMNRLTINNIKTTYCFWFAGRLFGAYSQYITWLGGMIGTFIIIYQSDSGSAALAGQSLAYFLLMTEYIQWPLRQFMSLDSTMSSCERTYKIIDIQKEAPFYQPGEAEIENEGNKEQTKQIKNDFEMQELKKPWPKSGLVEFKEVKMRYRPETDLVLKGLTFKMQPGQKIGCIGRTGAGKSSIIQAMFRMTEVEEGQIFYDGKDIKELGLHTLRGNISIIPQQPFVFNGTLRRNLDPLQNYSDKQIYQVLEDTNLIEKVNSFKKGLETDMTDVKSVFSVGQTQIICLARAILQNNPLIILDEATANVDMETDKFIQQKIKEKFTSNSILTIAHRLNTIADYDRIFVMDQGKIVEEGTPLQLLIEDFHPNKSYNVELTQITNQSSHFAQMVKHTGSQNSLAILKIAQEQHQQQFKNK